MIDPRRSLRGRIALVTTGLVSLSAAAAVGWAAATPIGPVASSANQTTNPATTQTSQQLTAAQANLQLARRDLARLVANEDDLPQAALANLPTVQLPTVQVPAAGVAPTVQTVPPVTHTTTGASGVVRP